jgi:hypothetical protein
MEQTGLKVIEETGVQVRDESTPSIVLMAMQKGYDPAFIEKMMDLSERQEKNEARKAFYLAVADFKSEPLEIEKDKENAQFSRGDKKAMYVSLGNLVTTVNPVLGKHGLSASWEIIQADKVVKVSCKLSHRLGHSEIVTMEAPPDVSGGNAKNPIQQIKSTVTYLKGATFEAVTGIAATDANLDDDGNGSSEAGTVTIDQITQINDLLKETKSDEKKFLGWLGAESVEKIPAGKYGKAVAELERKKKKEGK